MKEKKEDKGIWKKNFFTREYLSAILFLVGIVLIAAVTDVSFLRYQLTGEPDLSYWTQDAEADTEAVYTACMPLKLQFLNVNGGIGRAFGIRCMNEVIRMDNGQLTQVNPVIGEEQLRREADQVAELYRSLEEKEIRFLYLAAPVKEEEGNSKLPTGYRDHANENLDVFLAELQLQGVPYLDTGEMLRASGQELYDCFYNTDHHWTTQAGFQVFTGVAKWMEDHAGIDVEERLTDSDNYQYHTYKDIFLGTRGKRVGLLFGGLDDFTMILPDFETRFTDLDTGETGSFEDLLVNEEYLRADPDYLSSDIYDYALKSHPHVKNELAANGASVLFVSDSMGFAVQPYLALSVSQLHFLTAYEPQALFPMAVAEKPDLVIMMHSPALVLTSEAYFDFGCGNAAP